MLADLIKHSKPDLACLQELKASQAGTNPVTVYHSDFL
jgi:exonuclease III